MCINYIHPGVQLVAIVLAAVASIIYQAQPKCTDIPSPCPIWCLGLPGDNLLFGTLYPPFTATSRFDSGRMSADEVAVEIASGRGRCGYGHLSWPPPPPLPPPPMPSGSMPGLPGIENGVTTTLSGVVLTIGPTQDFTPPPPPKRGDCVEYCVPRGPRDDMCCWFSVYSSVVCQPGVGPFFAPGQLELIPDKCKSYAWFVTKTMLIEADVKHAARVLEDANDNLIKYLELMKATPYDPREVYDVVYAYSSVTWDKLDEPARQLFNDTWNKVLDHNGSRWMSLRLQIEVFVETVAHDQLQAIILEFDTLINSIRV